MHGFCICRVLAATYTQTGPNRDRPNKCAIAIVGDLEGELEFANTDIRRSGIKRPQELLPATCVGREEPNAAAGKGTKGPGLC